MKFNEKQIVDIISESVKTYIAEERLKQTIKQMVREGLENFGGYSQFETSDKEDGRLSDMNTESDDEAETRDSIENFFKQPGVNNAPYAYKLYGVEVKDGQDTNDMKNARKKFSDCVNHERNENGYPYSFSSEELNSLKGMISSNQLDESISKAMKKVLKEFVDDKESNQLEELLQILLKNGVKSAHLGSYKSGFPAIIINSDEYNKSNAYRISLKFAESRNMTVKEDSYPATTYISLRNY